MCLNPIDMFRGGARFLPLADGYGDSHLRCLHLQRGAALHTPSITHAAALLVVHGRINVITQFPFSNIQLHAGMGAIFADNEPYDLKSDSGAVVFIVEADEVIPYVRGISAPMRIAAETWPSDSMSA